MVGPRPVVFNASSASQAKLSPLRPFAAVDLVHDLCAILNVSPASQLRLSPSRPGSGIELLEAEMDRAEMFRREAATLAQDKQGLEEQVQGHSDNPSTL